MTFPLLGRGGKIDDLVKEGNKLAEFLHKKPALGLGDGIFGMELFIGELLRQEIFQFSTTQFQALTSSMKSELTRDSIMKCPLYLKKRKFVT